MNLKPLLFLKAASGEQVKSETPTAFSAVGSAGTFTPRTTNNYGTTIDSTSAEDNSVTVTQVYDSAYSPTGYQNGYIAVLFSKISEWIGAGKEITFSADIEITENPAEVTSFNAILSSTTKTANVTDGKVTFTWNGLSATTREYIEFRCGGASFTLSNCVLSIE
jgi:hypothetical protein